MRRAATIKDVAAAAGVGLATVSRVFSGTGSVSPATRDRVLAVAKELDYRPSAIGRSLKLQRTGSTGCWSPTSPIRSARNWPRAYWTAHGRSAST